ncbi:MAG: hypothetical protein D6790_08650, partial [Caldilineae bacterium]
MVIDDPRDRGIGFLAWKEEGALMATAEKNVKDARSRAQNGADRPTEIIVEEFITVRELANRMQRSPIDLIKVLMQFGIMAPIDQTLDHDTAVIVGDELGVTVKWPEVEEEAEEEEAPVEDNRPKERAFVEEVIANEDPKKLVERPPVVAVLGHVGHGKTRRLGRIRKTNV